MLILQKGLRRGFLGGGLPQKQGEGVKSEGDAPAHCAGTLIERVRVLESLIRDNGCDVADAEGSSAW